MKISFKELKGSKVYFEKDTEPWGLVVDVLFDKEKQKTSVLKIKTLSLIPLCKFTDICNICDISFKKIVLKNNSPYPKLSKITPEQLSLSQIFNQRFKKKRLKDIYFNCETGILCDIVVSKNILFESHKIPVNKISLKDNTIIEIH